MKKPTVLIVDDEKRFTDTFAEFLSERFNVDVLVRKSALEAIQVLDQQRVDVLFQDMMMPGPGGEQVIGHIKLIHSSLDQGVSKKRTFTYERR